MKVEENQYFMALRIKIGKMLLSSIHYMVLILSIINNHFINHYYYYCSYREIQRP